MDPNKTLACDYYAGSGKHDGGGARGPVGETVAEHRAAARERMRRRKHRKVAVRVRKAAEGWFDVVKEDGNEWIDTPPRAPLRVVGPSSPARPTAPERDFMLSERFQKAVHNLPTDCVAEAKAFPSLAALQYGTGQVLVKRSLRGLEHLPAFLIVPVEPHPDHKAAVERLGVKVVVP